jgi:hypothetical protein
MYELEEGKSIYLEKCKLGPCPECGGIGSIPSGWYESVGVQTVFAPKSPGDRLMLETALGLVRDAVAAEMPPEEFLEVVSERLPELSALWKLLPTNRAEAYNFWIMVAAILTMLLTAHVALRDRPTQVTLPAEILSAIQNAHQNIPSDSRIEPPERREDRTQPPISRKSPPDPPDEY